MYDDIEYFSVNNNSFRIDMSNPVGFVHVNREPITILTYAGLRKEIKEGLMIFGWTSWNNPTYFQL